MKPAAVSGRRVILRAWRPEEAARYVEARDDAVFALTTEEKELTADDCRRTITDALDDPLLAPFAICRADDIPIGNMAVVKAGDGATLSYWLAPAARGSGLATEALRLASTWAEETWGVETLELEILEENVASLRTAEAAGYHRHGLRLSSSCGGPALIFRRTTKSPRPSNVGS